MLDLTGPSFIIPCTVSRNPVIPRTDAMDCKIHPSIPLPPAPAPGWRPGRRRASLRPRLAPPPPAHLPQLRQPSRPPSELVEPAERARSGRHRPAQGPAGLLGGAPSPRCAYAYGWRCRWRWARRRWRTPPPSPPLPPRRRLATRVEEGATHNEAAWRGRLPGALKFLLAPWWAFGNGLAGFLVVG